MQNYFYDLHDQLVKAEIFKKDGTKESWCYTYDALGRRIGKGRLKNEEVSETSFPHDLGGNDLENQTRFVWDGSHLLQEVHPDGRYTYIYADPDSYEPLAQIRNRTTSEGESKQEIHYFHCDQIGIPREMTDKEGNLLWFGDYYGWGKLKSETNITETAHQPFRLQNQYFDQETGLHYNFFRYYEPDCGRFINQDPIGLLGGMNLYQFAFNASVWVDFLGLSEVVYRLLDQQGNTIYYGITNDAERRCAEHRDSGKQFSKMEILAEGLTHDEARTIEGALIRSKISPADELLSVKEQLDNSPLINKNRGRVKNRWTNKNPLKNWKNKFIKPKTVKKPGTCNENC